MKHSMIAFVVAVVALTACSKKEGTENTAKALAKVVDFKDRMCACKDKACADATRKELETWIGEAKAAGPKSDKPSADEEKKMGEATKELEGCYNKVAGK